MIASGAVNTVPLRGGRVRIVCHICGRCSQPLPTAGLVDLPAEWWMAPYPAGYRHSDGSQGALFTCPPCGARRDFPISPREYMRPGASA